MDDDKLEAVQGVVDRVSAYQDGASTGTVEAELRQGLVEAGVGLDDGQVAILVAALEDSPGDVNAAVLLG